jgi:hypothetical protein
MSSGRQLRGTEAYVVVAVGSPEIETARRAGVEILYEGESVGLIEFFREIPSGTRYLVLGGLNLGAFPGFGEWARSEMLRLESEAARFEAELAALRARLPIAVEGTEENAAGKNAGYMASALEVAVHDFLRPLRETLRRAAHRESEEEG